MNKKLPNKQNFDEAYSLYGTKIKRFIYFRVNDPNTAEDIFQDTFLKTWEYGISKRKRIKNMQSFLYKVAKNLIIDHYAEKAKRSLYYDEVSVQELSYQLNIEEIIDNKNKRKLIMDKLNNLRNIHKKIIIYRYFKDCSILEISQATHKSPNYVSVLLHEGTKILKQEINEELG